MSLSSNKLKSSFLFLILTCLPIFAAHISDTDKFAWSASSGWINFNPGSVGVTVSDSGLSGLSGFAWSENIGWIKMGSDEGAPYKNTTAENWGVNVDSSGNLTGFAWSSGCGWIHFSTAYDTVTIDTKGNFSGYAWGENIGWIHFGDGSSDYKVNTSWRLAKNVTTDNMDNHSFIVQNPVRWTGSELSFVIPSDLAGKWKFSIYNTRGDLFNQFSFNAAGGSVWLKNLAGMANGAYIFIARFSDGNGNIKLFKERFDVFP